MSTPLSIIEKIKSTKRLVTGTSSVIFSKETSSTVTLSELIHVLEEDGALIDRALIKIDDKYCMPVEYINGIHIFRKYYLTIAQSTKSFATADRYMRASLSEGLMRWNDKHQYTLSDHERVLFADFFGYLQVPVDENYFVSGYPHSMAKKARLMYEHHRLQRVANDIVSASTKNLPDFSKPIKVKEEKEWKVQAREMLSDGKSHKEIAQAVGKSTKSIQRLLKNETL